MNKKTPMVHSWKLVFEDCEALVIERWMGKDENDNSVQIGWRVYTEYDRHNTVEMTYKMLEDFDTIRKVEGVE